MCWWTLNPVQFSYEWLNPLQASINILRFRGWVQKTSHLVAAQDKNVPLLLKLATYQSRTICLSLSTLHALHIWALILDYNQKDLHPDSCRVWSGCMVWHLCSFHWADATDVDIHEYQRNQIFRGQNGREMKPGKAFQAFCIWPFKGIYWFLSWSCWE